MGGAGLSLLSIWLPLLPLLPLLLLLCMRSRDGRDEVWSGSCVREVGVRREERRRGDWGREEEMGQGR